MRDDTLKYKAETEAAPEPVRYRGLRMLVKILLPLLVLGVGIAGAAYIKKSGPEPRKKPPVRTEPLVEVVALRPTDERVVVQAMGTVIPAREMVLRSRVAGEIVKLHEDFMPGGYFKAGEDLLQIDPEDYALTVARRQSQVAEAQYALKVELGYQDVARREWQLLNGNKPAKSLDRELALRKPHLRKARADLKAAKSELQQARLDLGRTRVSAPFNAVVRTQAAEFGSQISAGEQLAELVGTDEYRIQVSVPLDRLRWIQIPRKPGDVGSEVRIRYRDGEYERTGRVIRLMSDLENEGRMARLLVAVRDPLNLESSDADPPPLLLGEYVRVAVEGQALSGVFRIPRTALRDDSHIWVAGEDGRLSVRSVETIWRDQETVLLKNGLRSGEQVVISDLATPVDGMGIRVAGAGKPDDKAVASRKSKKQGG